MTISTGDKIRALYKDRNDIDFRNSGEAIQQTLSLLTCSGINSAWVYTGTTRSYTEINGLLAIKPNLNKRIYAIIYVDYSDEYNIDFVHLGESAEIIKHQPGVFWEDLAGIYEQMYDQYVRDYQDGFIKI